MVIIRFSMDRTRWDSLKITTHLNFVSGNFSLDKSNSTQDAEMVDSPMTLAEPASPVSPADPSRDREKVVVGDHVRSASDMGLGLGAQRYAESLSLRSLGGSIFSGSKTSLPEFYV